MGSQNTLALSPIATTERLLTIMNVIDEDDNNLTKMVSQPGVDQVLLGHPADNAAIVEAQERVIPQDSIEDLIDDLDECEQDALDDLLEQGYKKFKKFKALQQIVNKKKELTGEVGGKITKKNVRELKLRNPRRKRAKHVKKSQKGPARRRKQSTVMV